MRDPVDKLTADFIRLLTLGQVDAAMLVARIIAARL
jgi:hypothetical protein